MISKNFLKSSFIYTVIGALPLASSVILLPFYTNFLETPDFGILAIYISFTFLIQIFVNFGFDTYTGIHFYEYKDNKEKLREYIGTVVISLLILGAFFTALSLLVGKISFGILFQQKEISFFPFGFMSVLTAICNSFFKTYTGLLINQQRPMRFFWVNLFNFILTIVISLAGLFLYPHTLIGPMWGRLLSGVGIFLLAFYFFYAEFGLAFQTKLLRGIFNFCLPIFIFFLMSWVLSYIDRYIINYFLTTSDVGVYDFAVKCTLLIDFLLMGLSNSVAPKIYKIWTDEKTGYSSTMEVNRYYNAFTAVTVLMIALTILCIPIFVPMIVYKESYYAAFEFVPLLSLSFVFRGVYTMYLMPILFLKKTKVLPKIFFFSAVIQIIVSILMVKQWGLMGVVWSMLITKPIQVLFLSYESKKIFQFTFNEMKLLVMPLAYLLIVIFADVFLREKINSIVLHAIELVLAGGMIFLVYRNEIKTLLQSLLKGSTRL
ncbi:MAG: oligosaccharide flippase family protein [Bacteroidetes bacterium]|nr:oligosaccharide flippase family protein [Bacteroidota bacterium]